MTDPFAVTSLLRAMASDIARYTSDRGDGLHDCAVPGLTYARQSQAHHAVGSIADPLLAIMVQGKKEIVLGDEVYAPAPGQHLVITVDLPVAAYLTHVTPREPYLGIKIALDRALLCDLLAVAPPHEVMPSSRGIALSPADPRLLDAVHRLMQLLETPRDIAALAPLILREIHYRLLTGDQAAAVHQVAAGGSAVHRIAGVIRHLRADFTRPVDVRELAQAANMSASAFHTHFKSVTSLSPLQYVKQLRLVEARRMMLADGVRAERAAFAVGYESASQFSREYGRLFGAPPISDVGRLKRTGGVAVDAV